MQSQFRRALGCMIARGQAQHLLKRRHYARPSAREAYQTAEDNHSKHRSKPKASICLTCFHPGPIKNPDRANHYRAATPLALACGLAEGATISKSRSSISPPDVGVETHGARCQIEQESTHLASVSAFRGSTYFRQTRTTPLGVFFCRSALRLAGWLILPPELRRIPLNSFHLDFKGTESGFLRSWPEDGQLPLSFPVYVPKEC